MILLESQKYKDLNKALELAYVNYDFDSWKRLCNEEICDGFANVINHSKTESVLERIGYENMDEWLFNIEQFEFNYTAPSKNSTFPPEAAIFYYLWVSFKWKIQECLSADSVPDKAGVLAYVANLDKCLVMRYDKKKGK